MNVRSPIMASIHETAQGLHLAGVLDRQAMQQFDDACLTQVESISLEELYPPRKTEGAR